MNRKFLLAVAFVSVGMLTFASTASVSASGRYAGVVPGQFLHYTGDYYLSGNDTELLDRMASGLLLRHILMNVTVLSVSGSNVTYQLIDYNETAVIDNGTGFINVDRGEGALRGAGLWFFVAANLNVSDSIYTSPSLEFCKINETVMTDYLGSSRGTNHLYFDYTFTNITAYGIILNETAREDEYWDKATGIWVYRDINANYSRSDGVGNVLAAHMRERVLILSTFPVIPEFPSALIVPLLMILALVGFVLRKTSWINRKRIAN